MVATAVALIVLACGSDGPAEPIATPPTPTATAAAFAFGGAADLLTEVTDCLADRGLDVNAAPGTRNAEFQTALQECANDAGVELPTRGRNSGGFAGFDPDELTDCLATEGIEVDVDDVGTPAQGPGELLGSLDQDDPAVAAARAACGFTPGERGPRR